MPIRRETEHGACVECTKLKLARQMASTTEALEAANAKYKAHLEEMLLDRMVDSRIADLSRLLGSIALGWLVFDQLLFLPLS